MELIEGHDYYVEDGLYVFTEGFLRRRGYCCKSGCRHCPYGFRKSANASKGQGGAGSDSPAESKS